MEFNIDPKRGVVYIKIYFENFNDLVEYSGMHHATIDSARMELAYAQGDDWGDYIKSIEIKEV